MMQMEIPTLAGKAPSVKSFFDAVLGQHKRFSFGGSTSSSKTLVQINPAAASSTVTLVPQQDVMSPRSAEEDQAETIRKLVCFLESLMLEDLPEDKSCFIGSAIPPISLQEYVERLVKYCNQSAEDPAGPTSTGLRCVLVAAEYLVRSQARLTPRSVHRYLMSAVLLAIKFTEDFAISNKFWGDVGGCKLEDVNRMEIAFCKALEWDFHVHSDAYIAQQTRFASPSF